MGGELSKPAQNPYARRTTDGEREREKPYVKTEREVEPVTSSTVSEVSEEPRVSNESRDLYRLFQDSSEDELYDGIPQYKRSAYQRSRSLTGNKVSDVAPRLGRVSSAGVGKAVDILSSFGSSSREGISSGSKNYNEMAIISFEVANTIVKGSNLMQCLSNQGIQRLKDVVLANEGIQRLISSDSDELLKIFASDKREELKCFSSEVVRFGNQCRDSQWHSLDRFFHKCSRDRTPSRQLKEAAEIAKLHLMAHVQITAELYDKLQILDRTEEAYKLKCQLEKKGARDESVKALWTQLKINRKLVEKLKKKSLWSRYMEEVMGKLVDIVLYLNQEIDNKFGHPGATISDKVRLGPSGLALHYANIILKIDSIVLNPSSLHPNARETLYRNLPPSLKHSLRKKLLSFHVDKEPTIAEIKDKMETTLSWLAVLALNTAKSYHGFGWVGEWMNKGREEKLGIAGKTEIEQIETLHYADKLKTEAYIMDLLVWLNYLVYQSRPLSDRNEPKTLASSSNGKLETGQKLTKNASQTVKKN